MGGGAHRRKLSTSALCTRDDALVAQRHTCSPITAWPAGADHPCQRCPADLAGCSRGFPGSLGAQVWPESGWQSWQQEPDFQPDLWQIAWDGGEVAGGVINVVDNQENSAYNRQRAMMDMIFTRRPWRKCGLAKALIARSLLRLRERGITEVTLSVDAENENGAVHLYKVMGFELFKQHTRYRKPLKTHDCPHRNLSLWAWS